MTQTNASASSQISSTSEELAGQAEELEANIAFFRTAEPRAVASVRKPVRTPAKPVRKVKAPVRSGASVADQQARARGFALDLSTGGPDGEDEDFGRAA